MNDLRTYMYVIISFASGGVYPGLRKLPKPPSMQLDHNRPILGDALVARLDPGFQLCCTPYRNIQKYAWLVALTVSCQKILAAPSRLGTSTVRAGLLLMCSDAQNVQ